MKSVCSMFFQYPKQFMTPNRFAKKFIFAIRRWFSACQELLYRTAHSTLEHSSGLQVMHHAQRHRFVALLLKVERQAARAQAERGIEHWRQRNAIAAIAHWPTVVVMQMVGVTEYGGRLPLQAFEGFDHCRVRADMIRVRVD